MFTNTFKPREPMPSYAFNPKVVLLQPVEVAQKNGMITRSSEFKPFDISEALAPFLSDDFEISSLVSVGALGKLKTTFMSQTSSMNIADSFDNLNFESDVPQS